MALSYSTGDGFRQRPHRLWIGAAEFVTAFFFNTLFSLTIVLSAAEGSGTSTTSVPLKLLFLRLLGRGYVNKSL